jgi:hypothetical protein
LTLGLRLELERLRAVADVQKSGLDAVYRGIRTEPQAHHRAGTFVFLNGGVASRACVVDVRAARRSPSKILRIAAIDDQLVASNIEKLDIRDVRAPATAATGRLTRIDLCALVCGLELD